MQLKFFVKIEWRWSSKTLKKVEKSQKSTKIERWENAESICKFFGTPSRFLVKLKKNSNGDTFFQVQGCWHTNVHW